MSDSPSTLPRFPDRLDDSSEERDWVTRIRGGDAAAFRAMYDRHGDAMFAFAYACLKSRDEAQDVVHDIFLNVLKNCATFSVSGELRTYLLRAVYNRVATLRRHLRVELVSHESIVRDAGFPTEWAYRGNADDPLLRHELGEALSRAVLALPPRAQQAYRLVREQELPYAEAAEVMGISTHTVEIHLIRALKALRDQLASWRK